jgi:hypothetical protein
MPFYRSDSFWNSSARNVDRHDSQCAGRMQRSNQRPRRRGLYLEHPWKFDAGHMAGKATDPRSLTSGDGCLLSIRPSGTV